MAFLRGGTRLTVGLLCRLSGLGLLVVTGCGRLGVELMSHPCVESGSARDGDEDGTPDCADLCPDDPDKIAPGVCGCMVAESSIDSDSDGQADCAEPCNGRNDASYVPDASCGVGYCRSSNTPSSCSDGVETECRAGSPLTDDDATCDGVDDNCSGAADEDYAPSSTSCGEGVCARTGELVCSAGQESDSCTPGEPSAASDDGTWPGNGLDDDCDGTVDEDSINPCDTTPMLFAAGAHANIAVPFGCGNVNVRLWGGGGGAGGKTSVGETGTPGRGGAGGYAEATVAISGTVDLFVGNGAAGCVDAGTNDGAATYNGGAGGAFAQNGQPGEDRLVEGGGDGGNGIAGNGGKGHYGGGGGGGGVLAAWPPYPGEGGGGGAASVLLMNGTAVVVAGGGGGGGGANGSSVASTGGPGGEGCGGTSGDGNAGGGGGGGMCSGTTTVQGVEGVPHDPAALPSGTAHGGTGDCGAGGPGYAVLSFAP